MRKEKFVQEEYYHIYNRTIANYRIFNDEKSAAKLSQGFFLIGKWKIIVKT